MSNGDKKVVPFLDIDIVIPDPGILVYLASKGLLGALLRMSDHIMITDAAYHEAIKTDAGIAEFISNNPDRVTIERSGFHELIRRAKAAPAFPLPPDMAELAIYGCINSIIKASPLTPTLIILADEWFTKNQVGVMPKGVHCTSLGVFLKALK